MTAGWAVRLDPARAGAAGGLRLRPGVLARLAADGLWVRGEASDDDLLRALRKLGVERYAVGGDGALTRVGERVPCGRLPAGDWLPLARVLVPAAPPAALPAAAVPAVPVRLVRGGPSAEANVLRTTLAAWADWARQASQVRLRVLRFAADALGRVLVHGSPLPPLPGERFVEDRGVVVPCGWRWRPGVEAGVLAKVLAVAEGDLAFLGEAGDCRVVAGTSFVAATRSAARRTLLAAGGRGGNRRDESSRSETPSGPPLPAGPAAGIVLAVER